MKSGARNKQDNAAITPIPLDALPWSEARLRIIGLNDTTGRRHLYDNDARGPLRKVYPTARITNVDEVFYKDTWPFMETLLGIGDAVDALYCVDRLNEEFQSDRPSRSCPDPKVLVQAGTERFTEYAGRFGDPHRAPIVERLLCTAVRLRAYLYFFWSSVDELEREIVDTANRFRLAPCILYEFNRLAVRLNIREYDALYFNLLPLFRNPRGLELLARSYDCSQNTAEAEAVLRETDRRKSEDAPKRFGGNPAGRDTEAA
jgi:hypothetical protein